MNNHIVATQSVWLEYHNVEEHHTMHINDWANGSGCDVWKDNVLLASLDMDDLRMLVIGTNCLGLLDLTEVKAESEKVFRNTRQREDYMKDIKEKFA